MDGVSGRGCWAVCGMVGRGEVVQLRSLHVQTGFNRLGGLVWRGSRTVTKTM